MEVTIGQTRRTAFTLIETLAVVAIIALLLSVLLPAVSAVRETVKSLQCASNMRTVTQQFELFVNGNSEAGRGDSERLGPRRFWINDFQEQLYRIDEFWDLGPKSSGQLISDRELMLCPAGVRRLTKSKGWPCGRQSVGPSQDVSLALNMRLYRAPVTFQGKTLLAPVVTTRVHANILNHPYVPLVLDVDGAEAASRGHAAYYVAPPIDGITDPYASGEYWPGSKRHGGMVNVGFVGGHVLKSRAPELEHWDWKYHAEVGR